MKGFNLKESIVGISDNQKTKEKTKVQALSLAKGRE
jgi:hypothetical protein